MSAPIRKIIHSTNAMRRQGKRGLVALSTFECGHQDWTKASERNKGKTYCFDCFYNNPIPPQGQITLNEFKCTHF